MGRLVEASVTVRLTSHATHPRNLARALCVGPVLASGGLGPLARHKGLGGSRGAVRSRGQGGLEGLGFDDRYARNGSIRWPRGLCGRCWRRRRQRGRVAQARGHEPRWRDRGRGWSSGSRRAKLDCSPLATAGRHHLHRSLGARDGGHETILADLALGEAEQEPGELESLRVMAAAGPARARPFPALALWRFWPSEPS
jgi:hypothetical protein